MNMRLLAAAVAVGVHARSVLLAFAVYWAGACLIEAVRSSAALVCLALRELQKEVRR
jgi:hypothetical protein